MTTDDMATDPENNEPADELYAHRNDPGEWEDDPTHIDVKPRQTEVVSFRLASQWVDALENAAAAADETISEFVRRAVIDRIRGDQNELSISVDSAIEEGGVLRFSAESVRGIRQSHNRSHPAELQDVPDTPPSFQQLVDSTPRETNSQG